MYLGRVSHTRFQWRHRSVDKQTIFDSVVFHYNNRHAKRVTWLGCQDDSSTFELYNVNYHDYSPRSVWIAYEIWQYKIYPIDWRIHHLHKWYIKKIVHACIRIGQLTVHNGNSTNWNGVTSTAKNQTQGTLCVVCRCLSASYFCLPTTSHSWKFSVQISQKEHTLLFNDGAVVQSRHLNHIRIFHGLYYDI